MAMWQQRMAARGGVCRIGESEGSSYAYVAMWRWRRSSWHRDISNASCHNMARMCNINGSHARNQSVVIMTSNNNVAVNGGSMCIKY